MLRAGKANNSILVTTLMNRSFSANRAATSIKPGDLLIYLMMTFVSKTTGFRSSSSVRPVIPHHPLEFHAVNASQNGAPFLATSLNRHNFSAVRRVGARPLGPSCRFLNKREKIVGDFAAARGDSLAGCRLRAIGDGRLPRGDFLRNFNGQPVAGRDFNRLLYGHAKPPGSFNYTENTLLLQGIKEEGILVDLVNK
jgi:hypothetical protein